MTWIKITDRKPSKEECERYAGWFLVMYRDWGRPDTSRYDGHHPDPAYEHGWKHAWGEMITHWMPLPELPKE